MATPRDLDGYADILYHIYVVFFRSSSVAEQSAVNRLAVGSNPTCGAKQRPDIPHFYYKKTQTIYRLATPHEESI